MKSVRLTLEYGAETVHPMHRFVADHEQFTSYELVTWRFRRDETILVFHVVGDPDAYESRLEAFEPPIAIDVTRERSSHAGDAEPFTVYVREEPEADRVAVVDAFMRGSLIPIPPLEFRMDWSVSFRLVGEPADITAALEAIPDGIDHIVERIGDYRGDGQLTGRLTSRQREALAVARDVGYYAVPREGSVAAVASELGCAPGTAAEHLRKAEQAVIAELEF